MRSDEIRELLHRDPFQPFKVIMSSGVAYRITNPRLAVALKSDVFIALDDGDHWTLCPYLHISSIQTLATGGPHDARN